MPVIRLSSSVINQIAAGEVVERPASVVKELLENAIDAGATRIEVVTAAGGKNLIRVSDDGAGMSRDDLVLAVERHCTSKLADDLLNIQTLGFRGEAIPSIGAVSQLRITTRQKGDKEAWQITVRDGKTGPVSPAALNRGTVVEVTNLFQSIPARLKFLKSDRAESGAITELFKRIALAFPEIRFSLTGTDRSALEYPATDRLGRINQVLGSQFGENALEVNARREGVVLTGFAGLPTFHRGNALHQYFFVNGRPVKDKALLGAVRGAYSDFLPRDRHGVLALFLELDPHEVDVNVHPAKSDVRFRDPALVRGLLVGSLKQAFAEAGHRASNQGTSSLMAAFKPPSTPAGQAAPTAPYDWAQSPNRPHETMAAQTDFAETQATYHAASPAEMPPGAMSNAGTEDAQHPTPSYPLGAARAQIHKNYIISQTEAGLVIVDQHAAHERIVYEGLKAGLRSGVSSQILLIPEIAELPEEDVDRLLNHREDLARYGLVLERFGPGAVAVRETPALLGEIDAVSLVRDLADEIAGWGSSQGLKDRLDHVAATMACHGSVRSGRILKTDEMNALLRTMEQTPNSGQCNHGRPTYIELGLKDIERLFGR